MRSPSHTFAALQNVKSQQKRDYLIFLSIYITLIYLKENINYIYNYYINSLITHAIIIEF